MTEFLDNLTVTKVFSWSCSGAMMIGGVVPYVPQYREIQRTDNADGFSTYVCLALLIANTLRIVFWFGHPFEIPLLLQSVIMNVAMLAMMQLCIKVRNRTQIIPVKPNFFTDFDAKHFWEWTDFLSYLEFVATFTAVMGVLMYFCLDVAIVVEAMGFLAVFTEAMLGAPQFYKNLMKKSTFGMSKKMVFLWTFGDIFKTAYFVVQQAPVQFWVCGVLQVLIDLCILLQVLLYRVTPSPVKMLIKGVQHQS